MNATTHFKVGFDGEALRAHEMDVRLFAPALTALADLFEEAAKLTSNGKGTAQINVRGNIKSGSIEIDLAMQVGLLAALKDLLVSDTVTAVLNAKDLLELVFGGVVTVCGLKKGLLWLIKTLQGKAPKVVQNNEDGTTTLSIEGSDILIDQRVILLYQNIHIRQAAYQMIKPLDEDGIDAFIAGEGDNVVEVVTKAERAYFVPPVIDDVQIIENESIQAFSIVSLSFKEENKWRLSDGSNTLNVEIRDSDFLKTVQQNEAVFAKGDVLVCELTTRQWRTMDGVKTEYAVNKVIEHQHAYRQVPLDGI